MPPALRSTLRRLWRSWSRPALLHRIGPFADGNGHMPKVCDEADSELQGLGFDFGSGYETGLWRLEPASDPSDTECVLEPAFYSLISVGNFVGKAEYPRRRKNGDFARSRNNGGENGGKERPSVNSRTGPHCAHRHRPTGGNRM